MSLQKYSSTIILLTLLLIGLGGCGVANQYDDRTRVDLSVGAPGNTLAQAPHSAAPALLAALIREAHAGALADSHPWLAYLTLELSASGYTTAGINADYNDNAFPMVTHEGRSVIRLDTVDGSIMVPNSVTITFTVSAYSQSGYRLFRAASTLTPQQMSAPSLELPISLVVDLDPAVPVFASDPNCPLDSDGDGLCDTYEDLFHDATGSYDINGHANIDGDNLPNYLDTDSDNDGLADNDPNEGTTPSNDGYPRFIHKNLAPLSVNASITTKVQQVSTPTLPWVDDPDVGDSHSITISVPPQNGSAWFDGGGNLLYQGYTGYIGRDTLTLRATDQGGLFVESPVNVQVNTLLPPVANDDSYSGEEDMPITGISPLDNDRSPDGLTLSIIAIDSRTAQGGSVVGGDFGYDYTPVANFSGQDSFGYTISDGVNQVSGRVVLNISEVNDPPTAVDDHYPDVLVNTTFTGSSVLSNDLDVEGPLQLVSMDSISAQGGTIVSLPDGGFRYTPAADYLGADSFNYTMSDSQITASATVTLQVRPDNFPPTAVNDSAATDEDTLLPAIAVLANDSDVEGDALSIVALDTSKLALGVSASITSDGQGIDFDPRTALDYLDAGEPLVQEIIYTVEDALGGRASASLMVTVSGVNDVPVFIAGESGQISVVTLADQAISLPSLFERIIDRDLETPIAYGTSPTPALNTLADNQDGTFLFTPAPGFIGTDNFTIEVVDPQQTGVIFNISVDVRAALPSGATRGWLGSVSNAWSEPDNWVPSGVPANGDALYIYAGTPFSPLIDSATPAIALGGLTVESGTSLQLEAPIITLGEGASLTSTGAITSSSGAWLQLTGYNMVSGVLPELRTNGPIALTADTTINGDLTISGALQDVSPIAAISTINGNLLCNTTSASTLSIQSTLNLNGSLQLTGGCALEMSSAASQLRVSANADLSSSALHQLIGGSMRLSGNLTLGDQSSLNSNPAHLLLLEGTTQQTLQFAAPQSQVIGSLGIDNDSSVILPNDLTASGMLTIVSDFWPTLNGSNTTLSVADLNVNGATFNALALTSSGLTRGLSNVDFVNMAPSATQLGLNLTGVTATLSNLSFMSAPTTGLYLQGDGASTITLTGANPGYGLPKTSALNGFVLNWGTGTEDSDNDGLTDADELNLHGTNPMLADSDGDIIPDGQEVAAGSDPLDPASTPLGAAITTGVVFDFEADNGGLWSPGTLWQHGVPSSGPGHAHSGNNVWATALDGNYPANAREYLYLPPFDLSSSLNPTLSLRIWATSWGGGDATSLEVYDATAASWQPLTAEIAPYNGTDGIGAPGWSFEGYHGGYVLSAASLLNYAGQTGVMVRIAFRSSPSLNAAGAYIDDLRLDDESVDADGDGILGVIAEFNSSGSDPFVADSDGDGSVDGSDPQPLNPAHYPGAPILSHTALLDFEADDGGLRSLGRTTGGIWAAPALWQSGSPASGPGPGHAYSGNNVWATNLSGNYFSGARESLYLPPIDLSAASNPTLSLRLWASAWGGGDATRVEVYDSGSASWLSLPAAIAAYDGSDALGQSGWAFQGYHGDYVLSAVSLSAYAGHSDLQLRLSFNSSDSLDAAGLYLDDLRINDESSDPDADGQVGIIDEFVARATDPFNPDSDGDGSNDGADPLPLNPAHYPGAPSLSQTSVLDFEADNGGLRSLGRSDGGIWAAPSLWQHGTPTSGPGHAFSGGNVWATNLAGNYFDSAREYLYLPPVDLSTASNTTLSLRLWASAWGGSDATHVEIYDSGSAQWVGLVAEIAPYDGTDVTGQGGWAIQGYQGDYVLGAVSLASFAGQSGLQLRLSFASSDSLTAAGVYLDNLRLDEEVSDPDADGSSGVITEFLALATDPFNPDSDGDSSLDGSDPQPLNPAHFPGAAVIAPGTLLDLEANDGGLRSFGRSDAGIWRPGSLWQYGAPTSGPGQAYDGLNVWATNLSGNYFSSATEALYLPPLDLTGSSNPTLSLRIWASAWGASDATSVEVYNAASAIWMPLPADIARYDGTDRIGHAGWAFQGYRANYALGAVSLLDYAGLANVQLRLMFRSSDSLDAAGAYIDAIRLDDEASDPDGDTLPGIIGEYMAHDTDPLVADTDGDGSSDATDPAPHNPAYSSTSGVLLDGSLLDFEASDGGLRTFGPIGGGIWAPGSLWAHGTPTNGPATALSGVNAWATNLTGNYFSSAVEALYLPPIDLSAVSATTLSLSLWANSWGDGDGTRMEALNPVSGAWEAITPTLLPYDGVNALSQPAWAIQNAAGYQRAELALDAYAGTPDLQLRLMFRSSDSLESQGFYFDDLQIGTLVDSDGDGLADSTELALGTNPLLADTDGDGFGDGHEVSAGSNPLDINSYPVGTTVSTGNANVAINTDTTWTLFGSPYLAQDSISIGTGATLTIEAGVVVKFAAGIRMSVADGANLVVAGEPAAPVVFTSLRDDSIAGDSDGLTLTPARGNWDRLIFNSGSGGSLSYLQLRYADDGMQVIGSSPTIDNYYASNNNYGLRIFGATGFTTAPMISNLTIDSPLYYALDISSTSGANTPVFNGANNIYATGSSFAAIYVNGAAAAPTLSGFSVQGGSYSLFLQGGAAGSYTNSTLSGASIAALHLENGSAPSVDASLLLDNAPFALHLFNQNLPAGITTATRSNITYPDVVRISGALQGTHSLVADPLGSGSSVWYIDNNLTVADDAVVSIEAGAVIKLTNASNLSVNRDVNASGVGGTLNTLGIPNTPVVITSWLDDTAGDSNADGTTTFATVGNWGSVRFLAGSQGSITDTAIRYCDVCLDMSGASPTLLGTQVAASNIGIRLIGDAALATSPSITDSVVDTTFYEGLYADASVGVVAPSIMGLSLFNIDTGNAAFYATGSGFNPTVQGMVMLNGAYGIVLDNGASGSYTSTSVDSAQIAAMRLMNGSAPAVFGATNSLRNAPVAYELVGQTLPASVGGESHFNIATPQLLPISGTLTGSQVMGADPLTTGSSVWQLVSSLSVADNATLEITAGTVIKSASPDYHLFAEADADASGVGGTLIVSGIPEAPVIFTSLYDDTIGGDSNADSNATLPAPNQVQGFGWFPGSGGGLASARVRYAFSGVTLLGASPDINNLQVENSYYGVSINGLPTATASPGLSGISISGSSFNSVVIDGLNGTVTPTFSGYNPITNAPAGFALVDVSGAGADPVMGGMELNGGSYGLRITAGANGLYSGNLIRDANLSGVLLASSGQVVLERNVIVANQDGGIDLQDVGPGSTIVHNLIRDNHSAANPGGGIRIAEINGDNPLIANNLIIENSALSGGGIYMAAGASADLQGNTLSGNLSLTGAAGGGLHAEATSSTALKHNIIALNNDPTPALAVGDDVAHSGLAGDFYNLTSDGSLVGTGSLSGDPLFVDAWSLSRSPIASVAVDRGMTNVLPTYLQALFSPSTSSDGAGDTFIGDMLDLGYHHDGAPRVVDPNLSSLNLMPTTVAPGGQAVITIAPIDSTLQPLGPGHNVQLVAPLNGTLSSVVDRGDGSYAAIYTAPATGTGSDTITAVVNGVTLTATGLVSW